MAKNILAFFGLVFLTLLIVVSVGVMGVFYDGLGIITLPPGIIETPISLLTPRPDTTRVDVVRINNVGGGRAEWTNPLDLLPTATPSPIPIPTVTPIPPLDPDVYRSQVISRLKNFASALETWLDVNQKLSQENGLVNDSDWRSQMQVALQAVGATAQALSEVGPAPQEYQGIDALLKQACQEAIGLQWNYNQALETGDNAFYVAGGENFQRVKEYLTQAAQAMVAAGWSFE